MIIDLQIKAEKSQFTNGQITSQNETASEQPRRGGGAHQHHDQTTTTMRFKNNEGVTPMIRTVENSQIGDGLRHEVD